MGQGIVEGWWQAADRQPSPNFSPREHAIDLLVIHNISLPPGEFGGAYVKDFFLNQLDITAHPWFENIRDTRVSAHCFIARTGHCTQFVSFNDIAWHAGVSCWKEREACNGFSIGIELEGCDTIAYTEQQYAQLVALTNALMRNYPAITMDNIVGHEHIAPGRKTDPGPAFDWEKYKSALHN